MQPKASTQRQPSWLWVCLAGCTFYSLQNFQIVIDLRADGDEYYIKALWENTPLISNNTNHRVNATASLCLVAKDPHVRYIDEWADYHFALGFTGLHVFDNSASFSLRDWGKDKPYAGNIRVEHFIPGLTHNVTDKGERTKNQDFAYLECIREAIAQNISWVAMFDLDEFLVMHHTDSVTEFMENHCQPPCGQVSFNWIPFGSSNRTRYVPVPVTRRFVHCEPVVSWIKAIVDPKAVNRSLPWLHTFHLAEGRTWLDTTGHVIRTRNKRWNRMHNHRKPTDHAVLNHYFYKSEQEWQAKQCTLGDINNMSRTCNETRVFFQSTFDDTAWQILHRLSPHYQMYDNVSDLG
uniref:Glycosyltransferase family 92 protein n=1 Tax=Helicotheca tamesis TaxID=374047 RepID=A0A7S2I374_9STRA